MRTKVQYRILVHGLLARQDRKVVIRKTWRSVARWVGWTRADKPLPEEFPLYLGGIGGHITVEREVVLQA